MRTSAAPDTRTRPVIDRLRRSNDAVVDWSGPVGEDHPEGCRGHTPARGTEGLSACGGPDLWEEDGWRRPPIGGQCRVRVGRSGAALVRDLERRHAAEP